MFHLNLILKYIYKLGLLLVKKLLCIEFTLFNIIFRFFII